MCSRVAQFFSETSADMRHGSYIVAVHKLGPLVVGVESSNPVQMCYFDPSIYAQCLHILQYCLSVVECRDLKFVAHDEHITHTNNRVDQV